MKKVLLIGFVTLSASFSYAQGYVGVVRALTSIDMDCQAGMSCDKTSKGWKIYSGSKLATPIELGIGSISKIEVSYLRFGDAYETGVTPVNYLDATDPLDPQPAIRSGSIKQNAKADAISISAVADFPLDNQFVFSARLGIAYVSSTLRTSIEERSNGAITASKIKPYAGLGVSYDIPSVLKIVGSFDVTQYDVAGRKGSAKMFALGAEKAF